jgi:hypothetical protein
MLSEIHNTINGDYENNELLEIQSDTTGISVTAKSKVYVA